MDINANAPMTAEVNGNVIEVDIDGKYVGTIGGYVDQFTGLSLYKAADIALMTTAKCLKPTPLLTSLCPIKLSLWDQRCKAPPQLDPAPAVHPKQW